MNFLGWRVVQPAGLGRGRKLHCVIRNWRWAEGGLLSPGSLLPGNWVILICIEEDERNIDVAFTSS